MKNPLEFAGKARYIGSLPRDGQLCDFMKWKLTVVLVTSTSQRTGKKGRKADIFFPLGQENAPDNAQVHA